MRATLTLLLLTGYLHVAAAAAQQPDSAPTLHPGDAIRVTVWRRPELSGEFAIAADGTITHPILRAVIVAGVPFAQVEIRLREFLAKFEADPQLVIQPLLRVAVGGEVRQPSLYTLPPETSLAQAVAIAGGATERGRLDRVRLFRGSGQELIDLTRPEAGRSHASVLSGDQLFVERKVSVFREYIAPGASVTAALAAVVGIILRYR